MTYFQNCQTLEEVKKLYRTLAMENHPDRGGSTEVMQKINAEYDYAIAYVLSGAAGTKFTQAEQDKEFEISEAYKNAIEAIAHLEGIIIELVGNWIWVSGNTYPHRAIIKGAGYLFASAKKCWYFRSEEYKVRSNKRQSLDQIKAKYGSTTIAGSFRTQLS